MGIKTYIKSIKGHMKVYLNQVYIFSETEPPLLLGLCYWKSSPELKSFLFVSDGLWLHGVQGQQSMEVQLKDFLFSETDPYVHELEQFCDGYFFRHTMHYSYRTYIDKQCSSVRLLVSCLLSQKKNSPIQNNDLEIIRNFTWR